MPLALPVEHITDGTVRHILCIDILGATPSVFMVNLKRHKYLLKGHALKMFGYLWLIAQSYHILAKTSSHHNSQLRTSNF